MVDFQMIKQAVSCGRLLADRGIQPASEHGGYAMYHSPLRDGDVHPSFSVFSGGTRWCDHATNAGGDVIDLAIALGMGESPREAAVLLAELYGVTSCTSAANYATPSTKVPQLEGKVEILRVVPLQSTELLNYIAERGIPQNVAKYFLRQVHYQVHSGKKYYGAGLLNVNGGYAVRSRYYKVNVGSAGISILGGVSYGRVAVFEGFMNCLSWLVDTGGHDGDAVILNSVTNVPAAVPVLDNYDIVEAFLDHDVPGAEALLRLQRECRCEVIDRSCAYESFNDYNDYLISKL